jgi:hypothetical protein
MLNETPFLTNCDPDVHDISSYSVCLGGSAGSITTGIYNFMAGLGAGASLDNDDYNILIGAYTGTSLTTAQDNTSIGFQSMFSATDALENISIGSNAMYYTKTPNYNVAIGHLAMTNATTSSSTVAIGYSAGTGAFQYGGLIGGPTSYANTYVGAYSGAEAQANPIGNTFLGYYSGKINTGDYNTYLGTNAGAGMFSGNYNNVAVGINAMYGNTSVGAGNNTALGDSALFSITSGDSNVAIGEDACYSMTTGTSNFCMGEASAYNGIAVTENTSIGTSALFNNITGNENVAIGSSALQRNLSATSSVAVGNEAGQGTGNYSSQGGTYIGYRAGENVATGSDFNTFLGHWAGKVVTTAASSTLLGYLSGSNLTTGSHNLSVGSNIEFPSATADNQLNIGNIIFGTDIDGVGSTLSTGKIGIGTTTPVATLAVNGTLFVGTTTAYTQATSTISHSLNVMGNLKVGTSSSYISPYSTSTFQGVNITQGCFAINNVCLSTGSGSSNWTDAGDYLTPLTTTDGILVNSATSTITNLVTVNSTSTNATTTTLYVSGTATTTFGGGLNVASGNVNLATGGVFLINNAGVLSATTLGSSVLTSSLTTVGALNAGSITSGFGTIDIGTDTLAAGTTTITNLVVSNLSTSTFAGSIAVNEVNATSTFAGGIDLSDGCFAVDGVCLSTGGGSITGSGAANKLSFWTSATNISYNDNLTWDNTNMRLGIGTSTPWGALSIVTSTDPVIAVATSTGAIPWLYAMSTTTTVHDNLPYRFAIGAYTYKGYPLVDQLYVNGRINTGNWIQEFCTSGFGEVTTVSADVLRGCGRYTYVEDVQGVISFANMDFKVEAGTGGLTGVAAAGNGMGIIMLNNSLQIATTTPVFETVVKMTNTFNSTSSIFTAGFTNYSGVSADYAVLPTDGCYFTASSTEANWRAVCSSSAANITIQDTGVATTTGGGGVDDIRWVGMRIELNGTQAVFYMKDGNGNWTTTNTIGTTQPDAAMTSGVTVGKVSAGNSNGLYVKFLKLWYNHANY